MPPFSSIYTTELFDHSSLPKTKLRFVWVSRQIGIPSNDFADAVILYGSETVLRKEYERSRIRAVQMYNLRGLLGIWIMDNVECMD